MKSNFGKVLILILVGLLFGAFFYFDLANYLSLEYLKSSRGQFQDLYTNNPVAMMVGFALTYVAVAALSLPGAAVLTLAGGAIFGFSIGTALVSISSTIGATLAFLAARFILRDTVQKRFGEKLDVINKGVEKEGAFYLFTLRLVPAFPFFLVNLVMGLTPIRVSVYSIVSLVGMLPGTCIYVYAGQEISQINSLGDIVSPGILLAISLLGIAPFVIKKLVDVFKARRIYKGYKRPGSYDYNMVVIGAGSAGLVSSLIAATVKAKVALIERHKMGGDCLNTGCVPSKALIKTAKIARLIKDHKKYGLESADFSIDFAKAMDRVHEVIKKIEPHDSVERYTGMGVECISGSAKIVSPWEVEVNGRTLTTKNIIIATGARPFVPPIPGLDKVNFLTSDNVWELRELPKKMVVLGGGPIGSELAQTFARLGSEVSQIERFSRIMGREDEDASIEVEKSFDRDGIKRLVEHDAKEIVSEGGVHKLICEKSDGTTVEVEFDQILLAIGRRANVTGFGLEELGIELNDRGTIDHDEYLRTKYPNIYVCGDVAGPYQFTHTASHQAWFASVNALFSPIKTFKADYRVIPWATYTDPEVARCGLSETEAKQQGVEMEVVKYGIDDLDRAIADSDDNGFVKVLVKPGTDKILGVTIVGVHAGDLIQEYVLAMKYNLGLNKIMGTIHTYPTLVEANKFAASEWKKKHKPEKLLEYVKKYHAWRRS